MCLCGVMHKDSKSYPPLLISLHILYDPFYDVVFVLVCPDGEVSVDSLSPAHTLSSVPSPASVEALSPPYFLQVSHRPQLFVLLSFLQHLTCISNANSYHCYWLRVFTCVHPLGAQLEQVKASSRWCPNSCSLLLDTHFRHLLTKALNTLSS